MYWLSPFSIPTLDFLAAKAPTTSSSTTEQVIGWAVAILVLLVPNIIAAKLYAPNATAVRMLSSGVLQIVFAAAIVCTLLAQPFIGWLAVAIICGVIFVLWSLVNGGIYEFRFDRGLQYTAFVGICLAAVVLGLHWLAESSFGQERKWKSPVRAVQEGFAHGMKLGALADRRNFGTVEEAQMVAVRRYPDLGRAGTPFNQRFLQKYHQHKAANPGMFESPGWPVVIAAEVATELGVP